MKNYYIAVLLVIFFTINIYTINCELDDIERIIKPKTDEKTQQKAALDVIRRLIHEKADNVAIKVNFKLPVNYFKVICITIRNSHSECAFSHLLAHIPGR